MSSIWKLVINPPKQQKWREFLQNLISSRNGSLKKNRNKAEIKIRKRTTLLWNDGRKERQEDYRYPTTERWQKRKTRILRLL